MKKLMMSVALVSAIAIVAGYSMIGSQKNEVSMNELAKSNVKVLANSPDPDDYIDCKFSLLKICVTPNKDHHFYRKIDNTGGGSPTD